MIIDNVFKEIKSLQDDIVATAADIIRVPAIAPDNGGNGESERADKVLQILNSIGFDRIDRVDAEDSRVPSGKRPNIIACHDGETEETLYIVSHLDVVPPGEASLWTVTKPFEPLVKDGRIYGRGSEDNIQAIVSSIFAVKALKNLGIRPKRNVALCFVADEEQGSKYGIEYLIAKGLFKKDDLVVVPDGGNSDGSFIETAEKSTLWLKVSTSGKQTHASRPGDGLNAHRVGMQYALALDKMLHEKYDAKNEQFTPPESTFEPTKKERNVEAVNIVPGEDVTYFDFRILPSYNVEQIQTETADLARKFEKDTGVQINIEAVHKFIAPEPTDPDARIVRLLKEAISTVRNVKPTVGGIGGGTCAAFFRRAGIPAVVWATVDELAHQPNENARIENLVEDAKIFAYLALCSN